MWKENLLNYLIVIVVLLALAVIIYCKVKKQTLLDVIRDLREAMSPMEE